MQKNHYSQIDFPIFSKFLGTDISNEEVTLYTLRNKNGAELSIMNYGATITSLKIPVSESEKIDVVLGFDSLENYINSYNLPSPPYFGTTVGRFAGRINNAQFEINGRQINLNKNHGNHNLHGGNLGFSRKFWNVLNTLQSADSTSITLQYISLTNEENFPGELTIKVTYTLTNNNELKVEYCAISTEDTVVNCTQHSYFNLDGHSGTIDNHELFINSKNILETTEELIPTGKFTRLEGHKYDFSKPTSCPKNIDTTFVLTKDDNTIATLFSKKNKLKMSVVTNQPAVHVYVGGNCFNEIKGKENANYHSNSGICFETQNFPDAPNHPNFPNSILKKGEKYSHQTTFKFENI